jgi:uncharacterized protein YecE (DUF72 family)
MHKPAPTYSIGIGGWEHENLESCFYTFPLSDSQDKLAFYAQVFDTVEVRATFWDDSLDETDATRWVHAVQENKRFRFSVKLHSAFTHKQIIKPQHTRNVRGILHTLLKAERLGTLLIQFPYSFTNTSANRFHLTKLADVFAGYPMHVEFRHASWNQAGTWDILKEHALSFVSIDTPRVKQFMPYSAAAAGNQAYLRLHGRNEKGWLLNGMDARYDYLYNEKELREIGRRFDILSNKSSHITVIFNNTTGGKAVANALQFSAMLKESKRVLVPAATVEEFPHLQDVSEPIEASRQLLIDTTYRRAI